MRLKGLRDIKTHGSLAREGRLIGVARNLHRLGSRQSKGGNTSVGWSIEQHIYPKKQSARPCRASTASLPHKLFLENQVRLSQIEVVRDSIQEVLQAIAEGISVAPNLIELLTKKLNKLTGG